MAGRRRLKGGAPRLLGNHHGVAGRYWYRECWDALVGEFGAIPAGLARLEAGRVCVAWVEFREAVTSLEAAKVQRVKGRGRRPGTGQIERLKRRLGLADGTYSQALDHFREMVTRQARDAASVEELLRRVDAASREGAGR